MSPQVRHLIGAVAGSAALPLVYYLTEAGARALRAAYAAFRPAPAGLGYLTAVAAIVALLAAWSWLSPLAALVCGLPLTATAALFALDLDVALDLAGRLPSFAVPTGQPEPTGQLVGAVAGEPPGALAGVTGLYAVIGVLLVLSALLPRRRRSILGG
ncbi:hypothetical protein [Nonomuraea aurantiaca]|uniref:hypothetical protein n=1 Tax=Nonomuraea aurantiaca TaxID=2878562 RepID=UPI001CDA408E|nr:hypothetical protein [Nonomuraea aurantiaca]MCA2223791.1 hypothetical protein [Nonomuraea aurantiaca]